MPGNKVDLEIGLIGNSTWHILGTMKMKANKTKNLQGKEWPIAEKYGCSRSEVRSQNRALKRDRHVSECEEVRRRIFS